jgi:hypothetical protein
MEMKPERIEDILSEHFMGCEPEGAKERILSRASAELRPPKRRGFSIAKWALAGTVAATILLAQVSDHARQVRLAQGQCQSPASITRAGAVLAEQHRMTEEMIALAGPWDYRQKERKGP